MKKVTRLLSYLISMALVVLMFTNCTETPKADPAVITITAGEVTQTNINATFTPNEATVSYEFAIGAASDLAAFTDGTLTGIVKVENGDTKEHNFENLENGTEYTIFAVGVNADNIKGEVATTKVSTQAEAGPAVVDITKGNITPTNITVTFTPNENTVGYEFAIGAASDLAAFTDGTLAGIVKVDNGDARENIFENLENETEYTIFAVGINADDVKGEVVTLTATTLEAYASTDIDVLGSTTHSLKLKITPSENTSSYKYALGTSADEADFAAGTMEGIIEVTGTETATIEKDFLAPSTEYIVFTESFNTSGFSGGVVKNSVSTENGPGISVVFDTITIPLAVSTTTPNDLCSNYYAMYASKMVWRDMVLTTGTYEDCLKTMKMYAFDFEMADEFEGVATVEWALNGYADYEFLFIVLSYDSAGNAVYQEFEFMSPSLDTSLPLPEKIEITMDNLSEDSATFTFTPKANTVGFFYALYTQANYDELYAIGEANEDLTGEQYIRDYTAFYGYSSFEGLTDTWSELAPGTEYIMVGAPFNANGSHHEYGYGETTLHTFTTSGTASAPRKTEGVIPSVKANKVEKVISKSTLLGIRK